MNVVFISSLNGTELSMISCLNGDDVEYSDIIGQNFIDTPKQVNFQLPVRIEMEEKLCRMNLGIRSATANAGYWLSEYSANTGFYSSLHGCYPCLSLPSPILQPVETNVRKIPHGQFPVLLILVKTFLNYGNKTKKI